ncbi:PA14 domain-containing protein [Neobacillus cucumis]|uniref:Beta-N-acetylglucosaminidase n=1 Tax=Neobacillus cucumis TaxID=1740721 RepID=A0A2N5HFM3_9BACI|nr:PA14 domain-containing protein [Neobacillus cucumis]PLS04326.1 hypothetical protein CVD27_11805 [Neobacillus cucumis]
MQFKNLILGVGAGLLSTIILASETHAAGQTSHYTQNGGEVHYNWGSGGPNGLKDNFTATFNQSKSLTAGDYFIQTLADDGVRVEADGNRLIDRYGYANGRMDQALWLGVTGGNHTIKADYIEYLNGAAVFSDVAKLDSWVAYYYPNDQLKGMPTKAKVITPMGTLKKLYEDSGTSSPVSGIPIDHFSARYTSAKRLPAGDYLLRIKADDGVRVYMDGKLVLDRWKEGAYQEQAIKIPITDRNVSNPAEKNIHWFEVQYRDDIWSSYVNFFVEPFNTALGDTWLAEYYPTRNLQGTPIVVGGVNSSNKISQLNFDWQKGSPSPYIPADNFSARYTKKASFKEGTYSFNVNSDDGVRVKVDGKTVLDSWKDGISAKEAMVYLTAGVHTVVVEYYEYAGPAKLSFTYTPFRQLSLPGTTVHYNWGESGPSGLKDRFTAAFNQTQVLNSGNYFVQTLADDGVRVDVDGKRLIDRWGQATGKFDQALWMNVTAGQHIIKTNYLEYVKGAGIFSDIVPFDSWLAYYYPNTSLSGFPTAAKVLKPTDSLKKLSENSGQGTPANGIPVDHFSARYTTAKKIAAGDYVLRTKADDGVRVYIDGQLVLDRWEKGAYKGEAVKVSISDRQVSNPIEKNVHWMEVQYREDTWTSSLETYLEPFESALDDAGWLGEYYSNGKFQGTPIVIGGKNASEKIPQLNFNWGTAAPNPSIPKDYFSARYTRKLNTTAGTYVFQANADDYVKVWVDGQKIIDGTRELLKNGIYLTSGSHKVVVEYQEDTAGAFLNLNYEKISSANVFYQYNGDIHYNWGSGSPRNGIPADNFQALFEQTNYYNAGDYFVQSHADDGIRVQADDKLLVDRWTAASGKLDRALWLGVTAGKHTIKTSYYDSLNDAAIFSDVVPFGSWLAYYYSNKDVTGLPTAAQVINADTKTTVLNVDNQMGNPAPGISSDNFSARYTTAKRITAGKYILKTKADDGLRVYIDGKLVVDRWTTGAYADDSMTISIADLDNTAQKDIHWIEIQYREDTSTSSFQFDLSPIPTTAQYVTAVKLPVYRSFSELSDYTKHLTYYNPSYTRYLELSYGDIVFLLDETAYAAQIKTVDGTIGWVQKDYLDQEPQKDPWYVKDARTIRSGPGTNYGSMGSVGSGSKVFLLDYLKTSGTYAEWYKIQTSTGMTGWIWGALNPGDNQGYDLIRYEFDKLGTITNQLTVFTPLNTKANVTADQINRFINYKTNGKTTMMTNMGAAYLEAQAKSGLNAIYLLAHSALETGWGNSGISQTKYNFYGIGAIDSQPAQGAYTYDTPQGGIIAGAIWISKNYVFRDQYMSNYAYPQPTVDNMRNDNSWHQYSTDEAWAPKIGYTANEFYNFINN